MTQQNFVELARAGNPKAIAALLNRNLQKHNITAKVDVKGDQLKVLFEADQAPEQARMYAFMQKGMESLKPEIIKKINLYGKAFGQDFHEWEQSFEIHITLESQFSSAEEVADKIRDMAKARTVPLEVEYESPFLPTQKIEKSEIDNSAYCPNCGSSHLQIRKDTNVSWGRAAVGWALFGAVGGAVGAITGEDRNSVVCLNCGTSWKAKDLYKIRETIKELTGKDLNLSQERDRYYLNSFVREIGPILEKLSRANTEADKILEECRLKEIQDPGYGLGCGCLISIIMFFIFLAGDGSVGLTFVLVWFVFIFLFPIFGTLIGRSHNKADRNTKLEMVERQKEKASKLKAEAKNSLDTKLANFFT